MENEVIDDKAFIDQFLADLQNENWRVRERAVDWLCKIKDARSIEPLILALNDRDSDIQEKALKGLKEITGKAFGQDSERWKGWWVNNRTTLTEREETIEKVKMEWLYEQVWRYHECGQREKLLETLLLLGDNFPESEEARVAFKSFYSSNYFNKQEKERLHQLITKYKSNERNASSSEINKSIKKAIYTMLLWGAINTILWFILGTKDRATISSHFMEIKPWMSLVLYGGLTIGIVLLAFGVLGLLIRRPIVLLLDAWGLLAVGVWNVASDFLATRALGEYGINFTVDILSVENWAWKILGIFQLVWGYRAFKTYSRVQSLFR